MNKVLKGVFIFSGGVAGGFILCGVTTIKLVVKSNTFRETIKDKIADKITNFLYGEKQSKSPNYVSYADSVFSSAIYKRRKEQQNRVHYQPYGKEQQNQVHYQPCFETRQDAEEFLSCIHDIFETYGSLTVADLYDICGLISSYRDNRIGWKDSDIIAQACIEHIKSGYVIKLPKPVELK